VIGKGLSGKTEVSRMMSNNLDFTVLDHKAIAEQVKGRLGTDEEPFDGEVPLAEIEKDISR
jgi:dephospho-CoA kinase